MREIRLSGSEGGETAIKAVFPTPIIRIHPSAALRQPLRPPLAPAVSFHRLSAAA